MQGAIFGAAAIVIVGFGIGGWTLASSAESQAAESAKIAVAEALAPFCVDNFESAASASDNLAVLKRKTAFEAGKFVADGGWAILPGSDAPIDGVADACAAMLASSK